MRSDYLTPDYLASQRINTPDPLRACFVGQQLVMQWSLPRLCVDAPIDLELSLRYGNHERESYTYTLPATSGSLVYQLINDDYWCRNGILAYRVRLSRNGQCINEKCSHMWAELIQFQE